MRIVPWIPLVAVALAPASTAAQGAEPLSALRPVLEARIAQHHGSVGLALIDPKTGESLAIRGDEPFPTASVIKVAILVELFQQIERGRIALDDPIELLDIDKRPGSGVLQFLSTPLRLTVHDGAFFMIAFSDNTATNLVVRKVGIRAVNARMDTLGLPGTALFAEVFGRSTTTISPDSSRMYGLGVTTPMEMGSLLSMIYRGEAVSPEASEQMVDLLRDQFYGIAELPRYLPAGTRVAHKTGEVDAARHDCGIVYDPARDYVLCVLTKENEDRSWRVDNEAYTLIADLSRIVHERLAGERGG